MAPEYLGLDIVREHDRGTMEPSRRQNTRMREIEYRNRWIVLKQLCDY